MNNITVIIHSYSYSSILECVQSAKLLTNHIYIVGEETRKEVKRDLEKLGVKVIYFPNPGIVEPARKFGIMQAKTPWIFLLDADEQISPLLAQEILNVIKDTSYGFFQIPRKELLFHSHWLKYGGWWPNYQTRLIQRRMFVDWPKHIHSTPVIKGKKGLLSESLLHYSQNDFSDIVNRTIVFESNESELLFKAKRHASTLTFFRKFLGELFRRLVRWQGFLDGSIGIIESIYQAFSKTITYLFLYERYKKNLRAVRSLPWYSWWR